MSTIDVTVKAGAVQIQMPHAGPYTLEELQAWLPNILETVSNAQLQPVLKVTVDALQEHFQRVGAIAAYSIKYSDKPLMRKRIIRDDKGLPVAIEEEPMLP